MTELTCYTHSNRPTTLRCNQCERPICASCAVRTPTGYRCKECVRGQQRIFNTAYWYDYVLGFVTAAILGGLASLLVGMVSGIGFFGWFIIAAGAPTAGIVIAEAVRFVTRRHRARALFITIIAGSILGVVPAILFHLFLFNLYNLLFLVIYLVLATPVIYTRLSGIQLFK